MINPTSWRPEVIADSSGQWVPNGWRFATEDEAWRSACDLRARWVLVRECRAAPSDEPVNARYTDVGELETL